MATLDDLISAPKTLSLDDLVKAPAKEKPLGMTPLGALFSGFEEALGMPVVEAITKYKIPAYKERFKKAEMEEYLPATIAGEFGGYTLPFGAIGKIPAFAKLAKAAMKKGIPLGTRLALNALRYGGELGTYETAKQAFLEKPIEEKAKKVAETSILGAVIAPLFSEALRPLERFIGRKNLLKEKPGITLGGETFTLDDLIKGKTGEINIPKALPPSTGQLQVELPPPSDYAKMFGIEPETPAAEFINKKMAGTPGGMMVAPKVAPQKIAGTSGGMMAAPKVAPPKMAIPDARIPESLARQKRIIDILNKARPIIAEQEALRTVERTRRIAIGEELEQRIGGKAGFEAKKAALAKELPKAQFEPIKIDEVDMDGLFKDIQASTILPFQKLTAEKGLERIFNGLLPRESELTLLNKVFGKDFTDAVLKQRPIIQKIIEGGGQLANIPRSIMSSFFDMSFGGRQGLWVAPAYRKQFFDSWKRQFKTFASEDAFNEVQKIIESNPNYELAVKSNVNFAEMDSVLNLREERFQSQWAEKIPVVGRGIRATARAYTAFANKFRMDIFDSLVESAKELGVKLTPELAESMGTFVNVATGRGSLHPSVAKIAPLLNAFFFSPRLMASRMTILNPTYYMMQPPLVRKAALKTAASYAGTLATILTTAKLSGIADVSVDPTNADFLKVKIGNTRLDFGAGLLQYLVLLGRLVSNATTSSITGERRELGKGYKPTTRLGLLGSFLESKEAPFPSLVTTLLKGQTPEGKPINVPSEVLKRFIPMTISDLVELVKEDPNMLPMITFPFFGIGMQTYKSNKKYRLK